MSPVPPQPYSFGYDNVDEFGNRQFHSEQADSNNAKTGSYGYRNVNGLYRRVNYVADAYGFRATVDTNEPGTAPGASADAVFNAAPVVPPFTSRNPYSFGYDTVDEFGNRQFRSEQGDANNVKTGSYGYRDVNGIYRRVSCIADANGFRATVDTNEPGTAPGASADAVFNAAPIVPPVPAGGAASGTFGARTTAPSYNSYAGGYGRYGGYDQYSRGAGGYGYGGYGSYGNSLNGPALGGYAYRGSAPYDYGAAGYNGGRYGPAGYGSWSAGASRRRR
ncbi:hypothetical protein MRX96_039434 [Rhipicephalus microplus]